MITDSERESAIRSLTASRGVLLSAVEGVTDEESRWKPSPERWSILEYVEHLAISDDGLVDLVRRILKAPPTEESPEQRAERETKLRSAKIERGVNQAPERLQPKNKFANVQEATDAFLAARERTLEFARTTQEDLRKHFAPHPVLGPLDGYQWLMGNSRHVESHSAHILELKTMWAEHAVGTPG
ncbi:MAG: DinB family protein [Bryobacteraceae bacterium]